MTNGGLRRFSLVGFAVALGTVGLGTAIGLAIIPTVGSYIGMLLGGFVAGVAIEDRPLLEAGTAAVIATLGILVAGSLIGTGLLAAVSALASIPLTALLPSVVLSFAVGVFGAHFGDDLRHGLTEPVETAPSTSTTPTASPMRHSVDEQADAESSETATDTPSEKEPTRQTEDDSTDLELESE